MLRILAERLTLEFGRGFSKANLKHMRRFFLLYQDRDPIAQTLSGGFQWLTSEREGQAEDQGIPQMISGQSTLRPFTLSWSHYVFLIGINSPDERRFYEIEATNQDWSLRELRRQFESSLYERLALSRDKEGIKQLARRGQVVSKPKDLFKEPLVLESLGLREQERFSESDLESAIILCKRKNDALVEITLPKEANIHAREYQLYLPGKEELRQKLEEWTEALG